MVVSTPVLTPVVVGEVFIRWWPVVRGEMRGEAIGCCFWWCAVGWGCLWQCRQAVFRRWRSGGWFCGGPATRRVEAEEGRGEREKEVKMAAVVFGETEGEDLVAVLRRLGREGKTEGGRWRRQEEDEGDMRESGRWCRVGGPTVRREERGDGDGTGFW
ncbi:hypothetical protein HAX54_037220 [Datura stramonium]|uniref:Uncharacterized protein n=1 Tax=Datura stramonium TaxID=4076 RepID=A0ABS8VI15_DATST|nr:hypothetical protein [Datura stramonium]